MLPGLGVGLKKLLPGHEGIAVGGRPLGVDGHIDHIGVPLPPDFLIRLQKLHGGVLGGGGQPGTGGQNPVKFLVGEIPAFGIALVAHGNGKGQDADAVALLQLLRDIAGRIGDDLDFSHVLPILM